MMVEGVLGTPHLLQCVWRGVGLWLGSGLRFGLRIGIGLGVRVRVRVRGLGLGLGLGLHLVGLVMVDLTPY